MLVELLVASSCTGLLAAGVLGLMVNTAGTVHDRLTRLDATMRAARCAEELSRDLRRSARGLESRLPLITSAGIVGVVEPDAAGANVALALPMAAPVEVDELVDGRYRVATPGALAVGMQVAVVGLADAAPAVPVAAVVRAGRVSSEGLVEVAWNASQLRILREHGPVRALVPLTLRTYQIRPARTGAELIRRDDGGRWQPVVDGLAGVEIDYGLVGDPGTQQLRAPASLSLPAAIVVARVDCAGARRRHARTCSPVGGDRATMSRFADGGAALLLVIGATSVLAMLSGLMLVAALASYEARSYRADLVQARALADAVVLQAMVALGDGSLPWPTPSRPVSVRNGVLEASRSAVPVAVFPTPPWTDWPPAVHSASLPGASVLGLGATATLSRVVGPGGDLRTVGDPAAHLVELDVVAWFRRARVEHRARLWIAVGAAGRID